MTLQFTAWRVVVVYVIREFLEGPNYSINKFDITTEVHDVRRTDSTIQCKKSLLKVAFPV